MINSLHFYSPSSLFLSSFRTAPSSSSILIFFLEVHYLNICFAKLCLSLAVRCVVLFETTCTCIYSGMLKLHSNKIPLGDRSFAVAGPRLRMSVTLIHISYNWANSKKIIRTRSRNSKYSGDIERERSGGICVIIEELWSTWNKHTLSGNTRNASHTARRWRRWLDWRMKILPEMISRM